jgi:hypothetical protein
MCQLEWKDLIGPCGVFLATIITQIVTVALLFANNKMTYKRSRREKLWDLKRELYSKVISKVSAIQSDYAMTTQFYHLNPGGDEEDAFRKTAAQMEYTSFPTIIQVQNVFRDNYLIFSRAFLRAFEPINDITLYDPSRNAESYGDVLIERKSLLATLHESLVAQARKELETGD